MPFDTRHAEIAKSFRRLSQTTYRTGISHIETTNSVFPNQLEVKWACVVVGENGVGKTNLFKSLESSSGNEVTFGNAVLKVKPDTTFKYYCPSDEVVSLREMAKTHLQDEVKDEILYQYEPLIFSPEDLDYINYLLSSSFSVIRVFEIDLDSSAFPYFVVESDRTRDLLQLSHGELYCIHLYWILKYGCDSNTVILLDEPETYLYPTAQKRLINIIMRMEFVRTSQVIFATHSQVIPSVLRAGSIYRMVKVENGVYDFFDDGEAFESNVLGLRSGKFGVVFTEDVKAAYFLKLLIDKAGYVGSSFEIVAASSGYSSFKHIWSNIENRTTGFKFIFCYDADAVKLAIVDNELEPSSLILPGCESPEKELISHVYADIMGFMNSSAVMNSLPDKKRSTFLTVLTENRGTNHHDFFLSIAQGIELDQFRLFEMFFDYWFTSTDSREKSDIFLERLNQLFSN